AGQQCPRPPPGTRALPASRISAAAERSLPYLDWYSTRRLISLHGRHKSLPRQQRAQLVIAVARQERSQVLILPACVQISAQQPLQSFRHQGCRNAISHWPRNRSITAGAATHAEIISID